jgi:hypothetical protein
MCIFELPVANHVPPMFGKKLHLGDCGAADGVPRSWATPPLLLPSSRLPPVAENLPPMSGCILVLPEASNVPPMFGKKLMPSNSRLDEVFDESVPAVRRHRF